MTNIRAKRKREEYASPLKTVGGNEGDKCVYPTRLDTYGKGCFFDCAYCYAKGLLDFRGLWNPLKPEPADLKNIFKIIKDTRPGECLRLGGMTDCFQPREAVDRITYNTIRMLNKRRVHYLIVTKNNMIIRKRYLSILDPGLAHIQVTIPSTENRILHKTDNAPSFEKRKETVEVLYKQGYDVSIRLSPFLFDHVDYRKLNSIKCDKICVEFLRVNKKITEKLGDIINPDDFTVKHNNYYHLPLKRKKLLLKNIKFPETTVCEDVTAHYDYFKREFNHNPDDCCNLTFMKTRDKYD